MTYNEHTTKYPLKTLFPWNDLLRMYTSFCSISANREFLP